MINCPTEALVERVLQFEKVWGENESVEIERVIPKFIHDLSKKWAFLKNPLCLDLVANLLDLRSGQFHV